MIEWVLKSREGRYLAPTALTKFSHITMGDCVPEQVYACRYDNRNEAVAMAVRVGTDAWQIVRLKKRSDAHAEELKATFADVLKAWRDEAGDRPGGIRKEHAELYIRAEKLVRAKSVKK